MSLQARLAYFIPAPRAPSLTWTASFPRLKPLRQKEVAVLPDLDKSLYDPQFGKMQWHAFTGGGRMLLSDKRESWCLLVQDHAEERAVDLKSAVVMNEA